MSNQFLSIKTTREPIGGQLDDNAFNTGTSSTAADLIELRWDTTQQTNGGTSPTRKEILQALEAFRHWIIEGSISADGANGIPPL